MVRAPLSGGLLAAVAPDDVAALMGGAAVKLPNCGVLVCTLDASGERPLRDCQLHWPPDGATRVLPPRKAGPWPWRRGYKVAPV